MKKNRILSKSYTQALTVAANASVYDTLTQDIVLDDNIMDRVLLKHLEVSVNLESDKVLDNWYIVLQPLVATSTVLKSTISANNSEEIKFTFTRNSPTLVDINLPIKGIRWSEYWITTVSALTGENATVTITAFFEAQE